LLAAREQVSDIPVLTIFLQSHYLSPEALALSHPELLALVFVVGYIPKFFSFLVPYSLPVFICEFYIHRHNASHQRQTASVASGLSGCMRLLADMSSSIA
jgi:hypothetical protein